MTEYERSRTMPAQPEHVFEQAANIDQMDTWLPEELHVDAGDLPAVTVHEDYSHLVFVCGPLHGPQIEELHRRFAHCVRIAVGTSVVDAESPAVTGFHRVLARDAPGAEPTPDLAARPARPARRRGHPHPRPAGVRSTPAARAGRRDGDPLAVRPGLRAPGA